MRHPMRQRERYSNCECGNETLCLIQRQKHSQIDAVRRTTLCEAKGSALYGSSIIKCISDTKRTLDTAAGKLLCPAFFHLFTRKIEPLSVKVSILHALQLCKPKVAQLSMGTYLIEHFQNASWSTTSMLSGTYSNVNFLNFSIRHLLPKLGFLSLFLASKKIT